MKTTQFKWLVTMILLVTALVVPTQAWADIEPSKPSGEGTSTSPYQISTAAELYWFAGLVNGDEKVCTGDVNRNLSACATLTADITVNSYVLDYDGTLNNNGDGFETWTPIGNNQKPYTGTFDGQRHTISGLFLNDSNADYVGLFGLIGSGGTVKNVGVVDSYFKAKYRVGGLCGENYYGTISNCYNTGTVSCKVSTDLEVYIGGVCGINFCGTITNCHNTGAVSGEYQGKDDTKIVFAGGVCGESMDGTIVNCYNTGTVNGKTTISRQISVGGVCAYSDGSIGISNCYNTGNVTGESASEYGYVNVGGVCASNGASISNCYSTGTVEGIAPEYVTVLSGGLCGETSGNISNCYYNSDMFTGGAFGEEYGTATNVDGKTTAQFASGEVCYLLNGSTSDGAWGQTLSGTGKQDYPVLGGLPVYYRDEVYTNTYGILIVGTNTITTSNEPPTWYEFTPSETGSYQFSSTQLTAGNLYVNTTKAESDYTDIATSPTYDLEAATTYYVAVSGAPGSYDLTITRLNNTPTAIETVTAPQIYAVDGRIVCEGEYRIYDLLGRDVTRLNGSLCGVYIVKTTDAAQKVIVK